MNAVVKKNPRILIISSLFPPDIVGGAEASAYNLAIQYRDNGWDVGILTTAKNAENTAYDIQVEGMRLWRVLMPRPYPMIDFPKAKGINKIIWHFLDHFDPRNKKIMANALDAFKPDLASINVLQGLGYNSISEITKRDIKINFVLHDLGLACIRMNMFKNGRECGTQCVSCKLSSTYKWSMLQKSRHLSFISPSQSNIDTLAKFTPVKSYKNKAILNPNTYPAPDAQRTPSQQTRLLYVGRLHTTKGVNLLLDALTELKDKYAFNITVIGDGQDSAMLRDKYKNSEWCTFTGHITQREISNYMINSDLMFTPSIWAENSPGVVVHALSLGLPVMGSNKGGIPELIKDGVTGKLVEAGNFMAWKNAIEEILRNPNTLEIWHKNCLSKTSDFDVNTITRQYLEFTSNI